MSTHDTSEWVVDDPPLSRIAPGWWHLLIGDTINEPKWEIGIVFQDGDKEFWHNSNEGVREWCMEQNGGLLQLRGYGRLRCVLASAPVLAPKHALEAHRVEMMQAALRELVG